MTTETLGNIRPIKIEEEMRASYLDYAMSVIVSRALPDVRDGLKPVQRRILYAMSEIGLRPGSQYKKSARIVGEVLGKYHPHGDDPVYEAMVRLAQDFSMRYPLVDGQGNFGSIDNDPPAAMRYTEARLAAIAEEMLADIDRNTVNFSPNFDDSLQEPVVLPARLPNLLVNGASGIAVGMATNIPPHNLSEVCDAIAFLIENPEATTEDLSAIVIGPDFPTGGVIFRYQKVRKPPVDGEGPTYEKQDAIRLAYADGKGRVVMRARAHIEEMARASRYQIVVTELPFQTNKAALVEKIADLVKDKRIDGIADLRDESDRHGMRIVIELKREAQPRHVLSVLYKHTAMQSAFAVNMLALVDGQPRTVSIKKVLESYINHRREVIRRRSEFDLEKAQERAHILEGLLKAIDQLDAVIQAIRRSPSAEEAKQRLMRAPFRFSDRQAQAILDMQLRRLARLERERLQAEYREVIQQIAYLEDLLANPRKIDFLIRDDAIEVKKKYGDDRRTEILDQEPEDFSEQDLVAHQEVIVTLSTRGYVKRLPLDTYRAQRRGGRGITGMRTREDDAVRLLAVGDTHDNLLVFTDRGRCFQVRFYELPDESRQARGVPIINIISLEQTERVTALVRCPPELEHDYLVLATRMGEVKKTPMKDFSVVRRSGLIAMDLEPEDELVAAKLASDEDTVILVTARGQSLRFPVKTLRAASRQSGGVRGIKLAPGDNVVAMDVAQKGKALLVVSALGHGKRTPVEEYPVQGRGGQGVITFKIHPKSGELVAARIVDPTQELMLVSRDGIVLRTAVEHISLIGRSTQGVKLMDVGQGDGVATITVVDMQKAYIDNGSLPTGVAEAVTPKSSRSRASTGKSPAKPATAARKPAAAAKKPESSKVSAQVKKPAPGKASAQDKKAPAARASRASQPKAAKEPKASQKPPARGQPRKKQG
ncbi:MAG TPA: DNA gyrase subunit A [Dehalococcoidia bacterium]|nr:DNA gyrase subunit A [Dehalococcoidia bacterium]